VGLFLRILLFQGLEEMESGIPLRLQLAGYQTVLGLYPVVLSAGALDLVPGAFKPVAPQLLQLLPLLFQLGKGGYGRFDPGGFDHL